MKRRLKTHLISYARLAVGYVGMPDDQRRGRVKSDYDAFLSGRAEILAKAAREACEGQTLDANVLVSDENA